MSRPVNIARLGLSGRMGIRCVFEGQAMTAKTMHKPCEYRHLQEAVDRMYEREKAAWIAANPGATHEEYQQAMKRIADEVRV